VSERQTACEDRPTSSKSIAGQYSKRGRSVCDLVDKDIAAYLKVFTKASAESLRWGSPRCETELSVDRDPDVDRLAGDIGGSIVGEPLAVVRGAENWASMHSTIRSRITLPEVPVVVAIRSMTARS
jgi:hypothetical protein